jgi:tRNA/rRNA methyltransferase/tRNA (cytidine32/uridine32-2'-O)-methyltransferase
MVLGDVIIVLCRPGESGNVGAVCRAMKNMGLSRLRLVAPAPMDEAVVKARAVHAGEIWDKARCFDTLEEALRDCALAVGTTRRRGRLRKALTQTPAETAAFLKARPGPGALVFGNERTGLDDRELGLCNLASHIPTDSGFPSLNLSHAVQIYGYELFRVLGEALPVEGTWVPLGREEAEGLVRSVSASLESLGFYRHPGREVHEQFFRDIVSRAGLTAREGAYLGDIVAKAARLAKNPGTSIRSKNPPENPQSLPES